MLLRLDVYLEIYEKYSCFSEMSCLTPRQYPCLFFFYAVLHYVTSFNKHSNLRKFATQVFLKDSIFQIVLKILYHMSKIVLKVYVSTSCQYFHIFLLK